MIWLIAEDEADIRTLIAMMVEIMGHRTLVFESGQRVWEWLDTVERGDFEGKLPDFVLLDIRMPGKRGNEVARRMRAMPTFRKHPIVLMTAYSLTSGEREQMAASDGVDAILPKPLPDFAELTGLLQAIQNRKHTENKLTDPPDPGEVTAVEAPPAGTEPTGHAPDGAGTTAPSDAPAQPAQAPPPPPARPTDKE